MNNEERKSSIGMDANNWVLLVYIIAVVMGLIPGLRYVAWLMPLIAYLVEKQSGFVRFYAMQAVALYVLYAIVVIVLDIISAAIAFSTIGGLFFNPVGSVMGALGGSIVLGVIGAIVMILAVVFMIIAMTKAYKYETYRIPLAAAFADKLASLGNKNK